jgi:hypothetical protein
LHDDAIVLLLGQPDGSLAFADHLDVHSEPIAIVTDDFDADGHADLATANAGPNTVAVFRGAGAASFAPSAAFPIGGDPTGLLVADIDGDGARDLLSTNVAECTVTLLLGRGDGLFDVHGSFRARTHPYTSVVGDFDGDARLDVLASNGALLLNQGGSPSFAWTNLGHAHAGAAGDPLLVGSGTLQPGSAGALTLSHAQALAVAGLLLSTASAPTPFKGGVLLPVPVLATLALVTDAEGASTVPWSAWPAGLAGLELSFQCAIVDGAASQGVALSNAVHAAVP